MPYMFCILHMTIVCFPMVSSCLRRISLCPYALLFYYHILLIRLARLTRVFYTRVRPRCFRLGTFGLSLFCFRMDYSASFFLSQLFVQSHFVETLIFTLVNSSVSCGLLYHMTCIILYTLLCISICVYDELSFCDVYYI